METAAIVPVPRRTDVVVVGAGPLAAACTLELVKAGASVVLLGRQDRDAGVQAPWQSLSFGLVPAGPMRELSELSRRGWTELNEQAAADSSRPLGLGTLGAYLVAADDEAMQGLLAGPCGPGSGAAKMSAAQLVKAVPGIRPDQHGGFRCQTDLQLDPELATAWLTAQAEELGAVVSTLQARRIVAKGQRVAGVNTDHGLIEADAVINTDDQPIAERDRTWISLERDAFIAYGAPQLDASVYLATGAVGRYPDVSLTPGAPGCVMVTGPARQGLDTRGRDLAVMRDLARKAIWLMPELARARPGAQLRYRRLLSPDGAALIGAEPKLAGLWHACGMASDAVAFAPGVARLVAQLVRGEEPEIDVAPFDPARFAEHPTEADGDAAADGEAVAAVATALGFPSWQELDEETEDEARAVEYAEAALAAQDEAAVATDAEPADAEAAAALEVANAPTGEMPVLVLAPEGGDQATLATEGGGTAPERAGGTDAEPEAEPEHEGESEAEPESASGTDAEPEAEPAPEVEPEAEPERQPEPAPDTEGEPASEAKPEPDAETEPASEAKPEPDTETEPATEAQPERDTEAEPKSAADSEPAPKPEAAAAKTPKKATASKSAASSQAARPKAATQAKTPSAKKAPASKAAAKTTTGKKAAGKARTSKPSAVKSAPSSSASAKAAQKAAAKPGRSGPRGSAGPKAASAGQKARSATPKTAATAPAKDSTQTAAKPAAAKTARPAAGAARSTPTPKKAASATRGLDGFDLDWAHGDELVAWPKETEAEPSSAPSAERRKPAAKAAPKSAKRAAAGRRPTGPRSVTSITATPREPADEPKEQA